MNQLTYAIPPTLTAYFDTANIPTYAPPPPHQPYAFIT